MASSTMPPYQPATSPSSTPMDPPTPRVTELEGAAIRRDSSAINDPGQDVPAQLAGTEQNLLVPPDRIRTSGIARRMSTERIMASSTMPPYQPATSPSSTPMDPPTPRVTGAAITEIRAP